MGMGEAASNVAFAGMPEREMVRLCRADGWVTASFGRRVLFRFDEADMGMRNLAMVALCDGGVPGVEVAGLFGLSADYVSKLRVRARRQGSSQLVRPRGRPSKVSGADLLKARRWGSEGISGRVIAQRLGVSDATVSRALSGVGVVVELLRDDTDTYDDEVGAGDDEGADVEGSDGEGSDGEGSDGEGVGVAGPGRIGVGEVSCRYAGAMLLHPFLDLVGAGDVFGSLWSGPARRYDSTVVALCALFGLSVGTGSMEAIKHLGRADLGALAGIGAAPELRALRHRLGALADGCDPGGMQAALTRALIASAAPPEQVFFIDDHFVAYYGARPVAKGWNTKRRHAQPGRDDTFIADLSGRALCFTSSEPSGLSVTMRAAVTELRQAYAEHPITLAFDRGGSFPVAFSWLRDQSVTWLTWRRAELIPTATPPRWSWFARDGRRHTYQIIDEPVTLAGYGPARQVTLIEAAEPVAQILTSDLTSTPARLVHLLRCRWKIENLFKYAAAHNGIDLLCDYRMDSIADQRPVANPERVAARATLRSLQAEQATTEKALGATLASVRHSPDKLAALTRLRDQHTMITDEIQDAKDELRRHRAKRAAADIDPDATRALPHLARRSLQMVLRLLAYNAELWLSEHLDAYLADPDEVRAITRHLLQQPGTITYTHRSITVTINRPDQPRVARSLEQLTQELNTTPAHIPGDNRPITYQLAP